MWGWLLFFAAVVAMIAYSACRVAGEADDREAAQRTTTPPDFMQEAVVDPVLEEETLHPQAEPILTSRFTDAEITAAAKTVWGEARGIASQMEQAAIVWCALNRVDFYGDSLGATVTAPNQFAYDAGNLTVDDAGRDLEELVRDVVSRWEREKQGEPGVGRVLPQNYLWFGGSNGRNWFRCDYDSFENLWDWSLPNPYES